MWLTNSTNMHPPNSNSEIILYQTEDGTSKIEVRLENETVWLSQAQLGELFQKAKATISEHLKNVFEEGELEESSVVRKFRTTASDGKSYDTTFYNLDVIISVGYRVKSHRGTQFRIWATQRLREYTEVSEAFFRTVQNKMHWAAHGNTAAEVIYYRIEAGKPNLGLTSFKGDKPTQQEAVIAKNYLNENELDILNRMVTAYLELAELQALNQKPMYMSDWIERLDDFLKMTGREILSHSGKISHQQAIEKAKIEYEKYKEQSKNQLSKVEEDFIKQIETGEKKFRKKDPNQSFSQ